MISQGKKRIRREREKERVKQRRRNGDIHMEVKCKTRTGLTKEENKQELYNWRRYGATEKEGKEGIIIVPVGWTDYSRLSWW
jgi:hypothetical protein